MWATQLTQRNSRGTFTANMIREVSKQRGVMWNWHASWRPPVDRKDEKDESYLKKDHS